MYKVGQNITFRKKLDSSLSFNYAFRAKGLIH